MKSIDYYLEQKKKNKYVICFFSVLFFYNVIAKYILGAIQMNKLIILLIVSIGFAKSFCMEEEDYYIKEASKALQKIDFNNAQIKYYITTKNITKILSILEMVKKVGRDLDTSGKKKVHNKILSLILDLLPMPEEFVANLNNEYCPDTDDSSITKTPSISPRTEDSASSLSPSRIKMYDELEESELGEIGLAEEHYKSNENLGALAPSKKNKFIFLTRIIEVLKHLKRSRDTIEGELRMHCHNSETEKFIKKYNENEGLIDINSLNGVKKAFIHYVIRVDDTVLLLFLLDKGAEIELADLKGETPLFKAVTSEKIEAIQCLLDHCANPYMRDKGGIYLQVTSRIKHKQVPTEEAFDPLIMAEQSKGGKKSPIKKMLKEYIINLPIERKFRFLAQAGRFREVKALLDKEENYEGIINSIDELSYKSALHYAVQQKEKYIILCLLKYHANPNLQDKQGNTPLHYAMMAEYEDGVMLLLYGTAEGIIGNFEFDYEYDGALIDIKNNHGYSSEEIALLLENKAILKLIEDKKNKKSIVENSGIPKFQKDTEKSERLPKQKTQKKKKSIRQKTKNSELKKSLSEKLDKPKPYQSERKPKKKKKGKQKFKKCKSIDISGSEYHSSEEPEEKEQSLTERIKRKSGIWNPLRKMKDKIK